ncbi:MAG: hypothetical protein WBB16_11210, partial [Aestuariivirga sp.]
MTVAVPGPIVTSSRLPSPFIKIAGSGQALSNAPVWTSANGSGATRVSFSDLFTSQNIVHVAALLFL